MKKPGSLRSATSVQEAYQAALKAQQAGQMDVARQGYLRILDQRPLAEPMFQLGQISAQSGDLAAAAKWYRRALKLKPKEPALWQALAEINTGGDRQKLIRQARAAGVTLRTNDAQLVDQADRLLDTGQVSKAKQMYRAAMKAGGSPVQVLTHMGGRLSAADDYTGALSALDEAVKLAPKAAAARVLRAGVFQTMGALDKAEADLRAALKTAPTHGRAWLSLMRGRKQPKDAADVVALEQQLADHVSDPEDRRLMSFGLAKALEDQGRYDTVFAHLNTANRITARRFPYGFENDLKTARDRLNSFQDDVFDGYEGAAPIFVVGLPRSGTTLVETILGVHADVAPGGEMALFGDTILPLAEALAAGDTPAGNDWWQAGRNWAEKALAKAGTGRVTDKSISTFALMGPVARALPKARFVLLNRDPRDVGLSIYKNLFPDGLHRYAYDLKEIGRFIRLFDATTAAWQNRLPGRVHVVEYEALTTEPEPQIRAMLAFCDLAWDPACLTPEHSSRAVKTLSVAQVRQPINRGSVAAWRRFEGDLKPLIDALETEIIL
ncbi:sulfotransferase family protein [Rhodophyticola sp. CCM32]|uniref:tetratricopeptide repeat-containing sulfotransferase family protein n=1 Tax=Rhodophyticola sp. CCM32 TaxID=2916397 RepID=UPI00107F886D|nr:tetratricopeptide repeat-containing sulfotransferase family protein [Rhodophyticola sp. CCM32]QBX99367.1 sulfotransferase family protein [Rhodophyticola sp. CCM32]